MKRSELNAILREAEAFLAAHRFLLPPFAAWSPDHWKTVGHEADEIRENGLGWDITDFGSGDFARTGLFLFTLRNGRPDGTGKPYAEKIMMVREGQVTPMHFHWQKREDIINRGGGNLVAELYNATDDETALAETDVTLSCDGVRRTLRAGSRLVLRPGESVTLDPYCYHSFWGETGKGTVLVGEVSEVNDDAADNRFLEPVGRFPAIEEDEPPYRYLCTGYPPAP